MIVENKNRRLWNLSRTTCTAREKLLVLQPNDSSLHGEVEQAVFDGVAASGEGVPVGSLLGGVVPEEARGCRVKDIPSGVIVYQKVCLSR